MAAGWVSPPLHSVIPLAVVSVRESVVGNSHCDRSLTMRLVLFNAATNLAGNGYTE